MNDSVSLTLGRLNISIPFAVMKDKLTVSPAIKIALGLSIAIALLAIGLERWQQSQYKKIDEIGEASWALVSVESGDRFTVVQNDKTKTIRLCGVDAKGDIAKDYLQMVLDKRDGEAVLEQSGDGYEAWITMKPSNAAELLENLPYEVEESSEVNIHLNTWMLERGYARRNMQTYEQCHEPEHLVWAEELAKQSELGIWQSSRH